MRIPACHRLFSRIRLPTSVPSGRFPAPGPSSLCTAPAIPFHSTPTASASATSGRHLPRPGTAAAAAKDRPPGPRILTVRTERRSCISPARNLRREGSRKCVRNASPPARDGWSLYHTVRGDGRRSWPLSVLINGRFRAPADRNGRRRGGTDRDRLLRGAGAPPRMEAESLQPKPWRDVHPCRGRNNRFGIRVHRDHMARPAPEKPKADCISPGVTKGR